MSRANGSRGGAVAILAAGMAAGLMIVSPVGAHVTERVSHVVRHMKKVFYTKVQSDERFLTASEGDTSFLTPAEGDASFLTPAEGDARYRSAGCGSDPNQVMVMVGSVCIDRYEASVWSAPTGGVQYGVGSDDYPCDNNGQNCVGLIFARSVPGVTPSRFITWFQAQQALANSGKRLPTNAEWQMAVAGTPDTTSCNINTGEAENTGANTGCISDWGTNDMVGNLSEWVADWDEEADASTTWSAGYGSDFSWFGDPTPSRLPGALVRGGGFFDNTNAGSFAIYNNTPSASGDAIGFRGAR